MTPLFIAQIVLTLFVFFMLLNSAAVMVYVERKVAAMLQQRLGPYLVGPKGLLQPLADVIKLMFKEELRPKAADAFLFALAPIISATCAFAAFAVVPFGAETTLFGLLDEPMRLQVADVNVAILVIFAISSMSVYGIVLAGWSSNSKYSLLGGLRSSAQMISYELSYGLALASVLLIGNSLSLTEIVDSQAGTWLGVVPRWFIFLQPLGFVIYMLAGHRRDQPRAVRFSRGRAGARRRLPHRVQQHELRDVLPRGVHQHGHGVGGGDRSVPRRLARAVPARVAGVDLVSAQGRRDSVLLRVDAVDAAALPLRPADGVRLEGAAAARGRQPARDGGGGPVFRQVMILFYVFAAVAVGASLLVIAQRNPIYSVLLLIASFGALSGLYVMLDAPFVAVIQIVVYAGAIMVLFLFVVMLLNAPQEDTEADERRHVLAAQRGR